MRLKSYFANSVQDAIDKARVELGSDAMLINTRQTDRDLKDVGSYEVVFGIPQTTAPSSPDRAAARGVTVKTGTDNELVLRELAELRKQIELFSQSVSRSNLTRATEQFTPELSHIYHRLLDAGFSANLSKELTEAVEVETRPNAERSQRLLREHGDMFARDLLRAVLHEEIASRFSVAPSLGEQAKFNAVMLVGPPGAGKTTSLVKLGFQHGLKAKRSLHFLSLDTLRIGGCDQLGKYARISGAEFRALPDESALAQAAVNLPRNCLALIDTPGFAKADAEELEALAPTLRNLPIEVQLVLPAYMSMDAALRICERFAPLSPAKLLLTHTDAISGTALPIELSIRSGLPLSFFGTGQQIPEDLQLADKATLMREIAQSERTLSMAA